MELMTMSYKDFVWEDNPTALTVTLEKNIRETALPYAGSRTDDLGLKKRRVTGEGYFTGPDCRERWERLKRLCGEDSPGSLQLPGQRPFMAHAESLSLVGVPGKDIIRYKFSFVESCARQEAAEIKYAAEGGESLWDVAWRFGRPIDALTAANPDIRDIGLLDPGQEVTVP